MNTLLMYVLPLLSFILSEIISYTFYTLLELARKKPPVFEALAQISHSRALTDSCQLLS